MRTLWLTAAAIAFSAFTLGALIGRRWRGDVADGFLTLIAVGTVILVAVVLARYFSGRVARGVGSTTGDKEQTDRRIALARHVILEKSKGTWTLRLADIGSLEFFQVAFRWPQIRAQSPDSHSWIRAERLPLVLFAGSLGVYVLTRLTALDQFPIYFFADEAIEGVLASRLLQNGLRDYQDHLLPVFFNTYGFFNPLISVYFHAIGIALLGKSIVVTRATSALITLGGTAAVGLLIKFGLRLRYWWAGVLCLAAIPAWFLHSRTAFETATMVALYAGFLLMYVLYRYRSPGYIFPALVLAAGTFYSYGNGQLVIGLTALLMAFSDWRYHATHWRTWLVAAALVLLLAIPYLQFQREHPNEAAYHLRTLDTYLLRPIPIEEKIKQFLANYAYGLSPQYWFLPNGQDLARHRMKDYGNIDVWMLPFFLIGVAVCVRRIRSSAHRLVLITAAAAPIGGALTQIAITRVLTFVIPASILVILGAEFLIDRIRSATLQRMAPAAVFGVMSLASVGMLSDSLANAPLWFNDYGLYGMQWGAKQLFEIIPTYLAQSPNTVVNVTSTWANGTDVFLDYFLPQEPRVRFSNVDALIAQKQTLESRMIYVMTPEELERARTSGKFKSIEADRVLHYPDGSNGFIFARLAYVDNIDQIFAAEEEGRKKPVEESLALDGESVRVSHSLFDSGRLENLFDKDTFTLARVMEANPAVLEFTFPAPRMIQGIAADFGTMDFVITATLQASGGEPATYTRTYRRLPHDPHIELDFDDPPPSIQRIRIEVQALDVGPFKIHIRELRFR